MKRLIPCLLLTAVFGCSNEKHEKVTDTSTSTTTEVVHDTVTKVVTDTTKDGTNIEINNDGVTYSNKDGDDGSSVKISGDSASVKIRKDN